MIPLTSFICLKLVIRYLNMLFLIKKNIIWKTAERFVCQKLNLYYNWPNSCCKRYEKKILALLNSFAYMFRAAEMYAEMSLA